MLDKNYKTLMLDVRLLDVRLCVKCFHVLFVFKGNRDLGVRPRRTGRKAWADYQKPSGGRPEGL